MKIRIETDTELLEDEVIIRCKELDEKIMSLQNVLAEHCRMEQCILLARGDTEYYVPIKDIYFFETEGKTIQAHTADKIFDAPFKLYELEEMLPGGFMRISKSTIANLDYIYSITRNLTASSIVEFRESNKKALVSRSYYKALVERLRIRRMGK